MSLSPLETWRAGGRRATVLGRSLFRVEAGASPRTPVVLVHGFPTSSHDWSAVIPLLAETRRVLALDLLGYGLSEKPWPHEYTIAEQTDLLEAWLAQEGVARAHLLAHDMGDTVVQELLARRLDGKPGLDPASIVLLNGGIIVERIRPILAQKLLRSRRLGPLAARLIGRRGFGRSLRQIAGKPHTDEEVAQLYALMEEGGGKRVYPGLVRYMDERVQHRDRWRRATLEHPYPMRLVWGDVDPISPFGMCEEVRVRRPATDVVRLEGTGHYPQIEEPERIARA
ncbi:MAG: alpha/beta fold hydrolase, partial [Planctomycetota bacterium]